MKIDRGDVVLVLFPNADLRTAKRRPAVVVQANDLQSGLGQTIVAMITSNMGRTGHASRVRIDVGTPQATKAGLRTNSVVMTDNLATIRHIEIDRTIGRIEPMDAVDAALRHTLCL